MTTSKWFGECSICKLPERSLSTTKTSTGRNVNYTIIRACDNCQSLIHQQIENILTALWEREQ